MQEKILRKILPQFAGLGAERLVELLHKKQNVNEFFIAKKMDLTINQTRNMLYKLADVGLVGFIRKKDKKKGGWYTYFWTLKTKRVVLKYKEETEEELGKLKTELGKRQNGRFYYSPAIEVEYTEEEAMLNDFTCPETGDVLEIREPKELVNKLKIEITKLEETLVQINQEIVEIEKKEQQAIGRKLKLEKAKKDEERKKRRLLREKEKKKEEKKFGKKKKKVKKKVKKKKAEKKKPAKKKSKPKKSKPKSKKKKKKR